MILRLFFSFSLCLDRQYHFKYSPGCHSLFLAEYSAFLKLLFVIFLKTMFFFLVLVLPVFFNFFSWFFNDLDSSSFFLHSPILCSQLSITLQYRVSHSRLYLFYDPWQFSYIWNYTEMNVIRKQKKKIDQHIPGRWLF